MRNRALVLMVIALVGCSAGSGVSAVSTTTAAPPRSTGHPTDSTQAREGDLDVDGLVAQLRRRGRTVRVVEPNGGDNGPFSVAPTSVWVDGELVGVYSYESVEARSAQSRGIRADGSEIRSPSGAVMVDWVGIPHFFAGGRLIVLYLGLNGTLTTDLAAILGPTLSPRVHGGRVRHEFCTNAAPGG